MGIETLPTRANGSEVDETWFNLIKAALVGIFAPRNSSYVSTSRSGSLGTSSLRWQSASVASAYCFMGMVKQKYRYAGAGILPDRGWMICDGRVINLANYDAEHGAGSYVADAIASSLILNKNLPNLSGNFIRGTTGDTQSGESAITTVGSTNSDISHTHDGGTLTSGDAQTYHLGPVSGAGATIWVQAHTHTCAIDALALTVANAPEFNEFHFYMRVV